MKRFLLLFIMIFSLCSCERKERVIYEYDIINNTPNPIVKVCSYHNDTIGFFIDTGANFSTIDEFYYKANKEQFYVINTKELVVTTVSGETKKQTNIVTYEFDNKIKSRFYTLDISKTVDVLSKKNNAIIVGVLGSDFFIQKDVVLDFENNKMYITDYVKVNK